MSCLKLYQQALAERKDAPFPFGLYKLEELHNVTFTRIQSKLKKILDGVPPSVCDGFLLGEENILMRDFFTNLPRTIGRDIVPAIRGLIGDGLTDQEVSVIVSTYQPEFESFIQHFDQMEAVLLNKFDPSAPVADKFWVLLLKGWVDQLVGLLGTLLSDVHRISSMRSSGNVEKSYAVT